MSQLDGPDITDPTFGRRKKIDHPRVAEPKPEMPDEDLTQPVPIGEPEDDGFIIEEEDPEYGPEPGKDRK